MWSWLSQGVFHYMNGTGFSNLFLTQHIEQPLKFLWVKFLSRYAPKNFLPELTNFCIKNNKNMVPLSTQARSRSSFQGVFHYMDGTGCRYFVSFVTK